MRSRLAALGPVVQDSPGGADFIVQGKVRIVPIGGGQQRVEIQWIVKAANGDERGKVVQLNDIPAGSLDRYWGDVAVVVASEAAGGVNDVIATRQSGREPGEPVHGQAQGSLLEGAGPAPSDRSDDPLRRPRRMKIVACNSNRPLAEAVAAALNLPLTRASDPPLRRHGGVRRDPRERPRRGRLRDPVDLLSGQRQR